MKKNKKRAFGLFFYGCFRKLCLTLGYQGVCRTRSYLEVNSVCCFFTILCKRKNARFPRTTCLALHARPSLGGLPARYCAGVSWKSPPLFKINIIVNTALFLGLIKQGSCLVISLYCSLDLLFGFLL
jgi:hypothetical protein